MTLTEIIETFKMKLNPSKVMNSLEGVADFYKESNDDSEGIDSGGNLKNNPQSDPVSEFIKSSNAVRPSQNGEVPLIKLIDVWKIYQMGEVKFAALKRMNLEVYETEFLVVIGPSGSGKSTLMNLFGCLDLPSKGKILLNSRDISGLDESELARIRGKMI